MGDIPGLASSPRMEAYSFIVFDFVEYGFENSCNPPIKMEIDGS